MSVKAIDKRSVHQICSGQVVLSLAVAVKELVENSLDAGATNIEVRLKEHGSELVEVSDNGCGVEPENFQGLCLKHHTSKLKDFSDLASVATFGFRGEALSSLCALSDLVVTTCHRSQTAGSRIEYDSNGCIKSKSTWAREVGTTVSLHNLFQTLPVRYREFQRNIKKEYARMVQMLQGYCVICTGVRITCYCQNGKGKKQLVVSTSGNSTIKQNIINVFGPKQVQQLVELTQCSAEDITREEDGVAPEVIDQFSLSGYVSRCNHGYGRSAADRQFFFFNSRPCDHPKLAKVVNEVYHTYNRHQYPFVVLDVKTAREHVDVNLTPDKRQVMLYQEKALLLLVKVSLTKMFDPMQSQYDASQVGTADKKRSEDSAVSSSAGGLISKISSLKRCFSYNSGNDSLQDGQPKPKQPKLFDFGVTKTISPRSASAASPSKHPLTQTSDDSRSCRETLTTSEESMDFIQISDDSFECTAGSRDHDNGCYSLVEVLEGKSFENSSGHSATENEATAHQSEIGIPIIQPIGEQNSSHVTRSAFQPISEPSSKVDQLNTDSRQEQETLDSSLETARRSREHVDHMNFERDAYCHGNHSTTTDITITGIEMDSEKPCRDGLQYSRTVNFDLEQTASRIEAMQTGEVQGSDKNMCGVFRAKIQPDSNAAAEDELRRVISKDMFAKMEVIGQFNLGFIIAKLNNDLFIVDQVSMPFSLGKTLPPLTTIKAPLHATDEKYNFERLQRETVIQHQRLLQSIIKIESLQLQSLKPMLLELPPVSEMVVMENVEVFKMSGFQFQIDHDAPSGKRVKLISQPVSKNWTFGPSDIEEMVFLLSDSSPGGVVRPSRVRAMFASRSCRTSIMVGTPLSKTDMKKLLVHMGEIQQPWNCPHGRPTMRHLLDLARLQKLNSTLNVDS